MHLDGLYASPFDVFPRVEGEVIVAAAMSRMLRKDHKKDKKKKIGKERFGGSMHG